MMIQNTSQKVRMGAQRCTIGPMHRTHAHVVAVVVAAISARRRASWASRETWVFGAGAGLKPKEENVDEVGVFVAVVGVVALEPKASVLASVHKLGLWLVDVGVVDVEVVVMGKFNVFSVKFRGVGVVVREEPVVMVMSMGVHGREVSLRAAAQCARGSSCCPCGQGHCEDL
jgi:hypothetical protein